MKIARCFITAVVTTDTKENTQSPRGDLENISVKKLSRSDAARLTVLPFGTGRLYRKFLALLFLLLGFRGW